MQYKSTTLFFKEGGSDKVYQASIEERDAGYVVNFAFGRRGAALKAGTKTAAPVSLAGPCRGLGPARGELPRTDFTVRRAHSGRV